MKVAIPSTIQLKEPAVSADTMKEKKLHDACADFEAIMLKQMFQMMRKSVPEGGIFEKGYTEEMYQAMQDEALANALAHGRGIGLGEVLYRQISGQIQQTPQKTR